MQFASVAKASILGEKPKVGKNKTEKALKKAEKEKKKLEKIAAVDSELADSVFLFSS